MKQSQSQSQSQGQAANSGESSKSNEAIPHATAHEGTAAADPNAPVADEPEEAPATSQPKDAYYDVGSGEEEAADGLDPESELVRQAAEEGAFEAPEDEDIPVFDRANRSERI